MSDLFPTDAPEARFVGWLRQGRGPWEPVVQAETLEGCWRELLAVQGGQHTERSVLPVGADPNGQTRRPRRFL
jgi:hypothetical protein